jgi:hypothetical protein
MSWVGAIRKRYAVTTDPLRTQRRIELVLLFLGMLLCLQLVFGGLRLATMGAPEAITPAADSLQVPEVRSPEVVAAGQRNEIISRPLFWTSRRPVDPVDMLSDIEPEGDKATQLDEIKLVGVFGGGDSAGIIALVKGEKRRILLGETIDGWKLDSIGDSRGVFVRGEKSETLNLERGSVSASSATVKKRRATRDATTVERPQGRVSHSTSSQDAATDTANRPAAPAGRDSGDNKGGLSLGGNGS